jgi:hypothetical protein
MKEYVKNKENFFFLHIGQHFFSIPIHFDKQ